MFHVKHRSLDCAHLPLDPDIQAQLETYSGLVRRWSATINLVGTHEHVDFWHRHVADSLQLLPLLPVQGVALDLGSGAGLPGLVLAIAGRRHVHLVEADQRKTAFLREAARRCGASVTLHATRIEHASPPLADVITARAVAPLSRLLALAAPHLAPGGVCLFPKGVQWSDELTRAAADWHMQVEQWPSRTNSDAVILQISGLTPRAKS